MNGKISSSLLGLPGKTIKCVQTKKLKLKQAGIID
jgi:hypothetical protein